MASNKSGKCEALAVSGLVEYEDEIDVIAPTDILKQIFKMPYSKGRLSIAVRRIGNTLVLNAGPDAEEGDKLNRRFTNFSKYADKSSFGNVPTHSVRMEACDCPPGLDVSSNPQSSSSVVPGQVQTNNSSEVAYDLSKGKSSQYRSVSDDVLQTEALSRYSEYKHAKEEELQMKSNNKKINKGYVTKTSPLGAKTKRSVQESERCKRVGKDEFLRVLFWQFCNFRMLLGSDLLLFSNDKYVAVSLHLCDISQKVNSLTWLDFWLDNVMASVPELAICYHESGVVKGYELLKTDEIFLLKGISEDGTPAFHPHVVQQNGLAVLRFLKENCKQDPGAYWLYKTGGEDAIQLFDLSVIPPNQPSDDVSDDTASLPSSVLRGRSECLFALGTLLYRVAHRLSLLMGPNWSKCAEFFKKCLDFLYEPDHMVVRASAHEQFARLLLNYEAELDLSSDCLLSESEVRAFDANEVPIDLLTNSSESSNGRKISCFAGEDEHADIGNHIEELTPDVSADMTMDASRRFLTSPGLDASYITGISSSSNGDEAFALCERSQRHVRVIQSDSDPVSSKLAAIHHVQQAIKSIRFMREHRGSEPESVNQPSPSLGSSMPGTGTYTYSVCACGDGDCIEVCDIRAWLPTSKLDHKLWKLVLLLGESYLALGQAYKEDGQLYQALKVVALACSLYGSMPQYFGDAKFISSLGSDSSFKRTTGNDNNAAFTDAPVKISVMETDKHHGQSAQRISSVYLFWAKAWILVGDIFVEFHMLKGKATPEKLERNYIRELRMSSEVVKEVERLKNKVGKLNKNCESCSLVNCSCQSDRASSGSSASSSADTQTFVLGRKQNKKVKSKGFSNPNTYPINRAFNRKISKSDLRDQFSRLHSGDSQVYNGTGVEGVEMATGFKVTQGGQKVDNYNETFGETTQNKKGKLKSGGIFKYLECNFFQDEDGYLKAAFDCFGEANNALDGISNDSSIMQAVIKKKGWVCNELGRYWLDRKELEKAEIAFADAVDSFKEASDYTNILLINLNLGHGRRALAEETVSKMETLKNYQFLHAAYNQALGTAKREYRKSLKYYRDAKLQLNYMAAETGDVIQGLKNEVYTQFANTYLRLGMLLAKEHLAAVESENGGLEDGYKIQNTSSEERFTHEPKMNEMTANEALREALSLYESLGDLRKQEAAYAYYQIACHQRDCCFKFLASDNNLNSPKGENTNLQRAKQYVSLAERNWQRALDFYGPKSHPGMYLAILMERAALLFSFTNSFRSNAILETALSCLLDGRHICEENTSSPLKNDIPDVYTKFWSQLQLILKKMLSVAVSVSGKKSLNPALDPNKSKEVGKLKEMYKMALKSTDFTQLHAMHKLWTS